MYLSVFRSSKNRCLFSLWPGSSPQWFCPCSCFIFQLSLFVFYSGPSMTPCQRRKEFVDFFMNNEVLFKAFTNRARRFASVRDPIIKIIHPECDSENEFLPLQCSKNIDNNQVSCIKLTIIYLSTDNFLVHKNIMFLKVSLACLSLLEILSLKLYNIKLGRFTI